MYNSRAIIPAINPLQVALYLSLLAMCGASCRPYESTVRSSQDNLLSQHETTPRPKAPEQMRIPMTYVDSGFPLGQAATQTYTPQWTETRPDSIESEPPSTHAIRYWGKIVLGDLRRPGTFAIMIDDDRPGPVPRWYQPSRSPSLQKAVNTGTQGMANDLQFELEYQEGNETVRVPYHLWFFINNQQWTKHIAGYYSRCHMKGELTYRDNHYSVTIFDNAPSNGDYSDNPVIIDLNHNNRVDSNESFRPGDPIRLDTSPGTTTWTLKPVPPSGREVTLALNSSE